MISSLVRFREAELLHSPFCVVWFLPVLHTPLLLCPFHSQQAPTTPTKSPEPLRRDIPAPVTPAPKTPAPKTPAEGKKGNPIFAKPDGLVDDTREILAVRGNLFWFDPFQGVYELQAEAVVISILQKSAGLRCESSFFSPVFPCSSFLTLFFALSATQLSPPTLLCYGDGIQLSSMFMMSPEKPPSRVSSSPRT